MIVMMRRTSELISLRVKKLLVNYGSKQEHNRKLRSNYSFCVVRSSRKLLCGALRPTLIIFLLASFEVSIFFGIIESQFGSVDEDAEIRR